MNTRNFIFLDGEILDGNRPTLMVNNSMFQRGDGVHEDLLAFGTEARHLNKHIEHLNVALKILDIERPYLLYSEDNMAKTITRLLNKNRFFNNARVRITVFRGKEDNEPSICIENQDLTVKQYPYNNDGLRVDVYDTIKKPINILSQLAGNQGHLWTKAQQFAKRRGLDNALIINTEGRITETVGANIFIVMGNRLYTPSLAEGCCTNVMRNLICEIAPKLGTDIDNQVGITINAVLKARELFFADPINGIQWVMACGEQRYYHEISQKIHQTINQMTFG